MALSRNGRGHVMRKVAEYEVRAEECRRLAAQMKDPGRRSSLRTWPRLGSCWLGHV